LSFVFQDGIVAAVDSRASLGNFVGSKTVQKVLPINSHMLGTMAGGAADCSFWIRKLKAEAELFELASGYRMSVARASRLLSNALYENRGSDLSVGTMIMGFDPDGGPRIYYVDDSGARIEGDMFSVGSGSTFALGILDRERRFDMTKEEAIALGIKAIRHATFRDAYSGGFINVFLITSDGWKKVFSEDIAGSAGIAQGESAETVVQEV
jgi:20S proteasome subunit beta 5